MTNASDKTFGLSKKRKQKVWIVFLFVVTLVLFIARLEGDPVGALFIIVPAVLILIIILRAHLTISHDYIQTTDGILTFKSSWDDIEKVLPYGLLAKQPVMSYKKWAAPVVWRLGYWRESPFSRTIHLAQFDKNWLDGEIGSDVAKHIPELIERYRLESTLGTR
jgi:hypothetical protein